MIGVRNVRSGFPFSHPSMVGFLYFYDRILQDVFFLVKIVIFRDKLKNTVVVVCEPCPSITSMRINQRTLLSDYYRFANEDYHNLLTSIKIGDFLEKTHDKDPNIYSDLTEDTILDKGLVLSVSWILSLTRATKIVDSLITEHSVLVFFNCHHPVVDELDRLVSEDNVVTTIFLNLRQNLLEPTSAFSIVNFQDSHLPTNPISRHLTHLSIEYTVIAAKIDKISAANEKGWSTERV